MSNLLKNTYSFVSGKNWKLSLAEIVAYLEAKGCTFEISDFSRSFFVMKTQLALNQSAVDDLGGTLKIVEVAGFVPTERVTDAFLKENKPVKKQLTFDFPLDALADGIVSAELLGRPNLSPGCKGGTAFSRQRVKR
jgi:hypothetical protein